MKATNGKLNIVWKADVRFPVAVRPADGVAQIVNGRHRRLIPGKRSRILRIDSPRYIRLAAGVANHWRSGLVVNLHSA